MPKNLMMMMMMQHVLVINKNICAQLLR
jgi:hypothetical protein